MQPTIEQAIFELFGDEADFILPTAQRVLADTAVPVADLPEGVAIDTQQMDEIRVLWRDVREALESGNWVRYGELLNELDGKINSL